MKTSSKGIYPRHFKYMQCWEIQPRRRCASMARLLHTAIWTSATLTSNHRRRILLPRNDQTVPPRCRDSVLTTISMVFPPLFIIRKPDDDDYKQTKTSRPSTWLFLEATSKGQGRLVLQPLLVDVRMVRPSPLVSVCGACWSQFSRNFFSWCQDFPQARVVRSHNAIREHFVVTG